MGKCKYLKAPNYKICIGSLKHSCEFSTRNEVFQKDEDIGSDEEFTIISTQYVAISTTKGIDIFDGVNVIGNASHIITSRYLSIIKEIRWLKVNGEYYKVLNVVNSGQQNKFLQFFCSKRGITTNKANKR